MRPTATGDLPMIPSDQRVVVVDLRIPYTRLVFFFIKLTLAAIPAVMIVGAIGMVVSAVIAAFLGGNFDAITGRLPI
jgi:hypothetical protein